MRTRFELTLPGVLLGVVVAAIVVAGLVTPATSAGAAGRSVDLNPVFSPDGQRVAFLRTTTAEQGGLAGGGIMVIGADGRGLRVLVPRSMASGLKWSPDGSSLVYAADGFLWIVEIESGAVRRVHDANDVSPGGAAQPSWSPDGRTIAYWRWDSCWRCTAIWLIGADGSNNHRVVSGGRRPMFSPDGTMLALSFGYSGLVIDLDGKAILPPPRGGPTSYTTWSPRGIYVTNTGDGLWLRNIVTKRVRRLTPLVNSKPAWAFDGKVIAGGAGRLVALVRVKDGKVFARFARSNIDGGVPSWSPAGEVAFVRENNCGIDVAREDGTHRRRLTRAC